MPEQGTDLRKITNPYYTYGILHLSDNFHRWEKSRGPEYHAYRRAWAERMARLDPGDFPLNLNMEVTTRCNLACTFCTQPSLTQDQLGDMPWELYARILERVEEDLKNTEIREILDLCARDLATAYQKMLSKSK